MNLSEIAAMISVALNVGIAIAGATWGIGKIKDVVRDAMDKHKQENADALADLTRGFTDTFTALRQHINDVDGKLWKKIGEVELDTAKHYMRKDSFYQVKGEITDALKDFRTEVKESLIRLETKIDTKT